jgi:hypothetical protein
MLFLIAGLLGLRSVNDASFVDYSILFMTQAENGGRYK